MDQLFNWIVGLLKDARFWQIVLPWERAVRVRFGRWMVLWEPGFHLRVPFFDDVRLVNTRLRVAPVPCQTVATRDRVAVTIGGLIAFRITDPLVAIMRLHDPASCAGAFAQAALAEYVAAHDYKELKPGDLEGHALQGLNALGPAFVFESVKIVDFAAVRTLRLLQENWRPHTGDGGGGL